MYYVYYSVLLCVIQCTTHSTMQYVVLLTATAAARVSSLIQSERRTETRESYKKQIQEHTALYVANVPSCLC